MFSLCPSNESFTDQACLLKDPGFLPSSFFFVAALDFFSVCSSARKNLDKIHASSVNKLGARWNKLKEIINGFARSATQTH